MQTEVTSVGIRLRPHAVSVGPEHFHDRFHPADSHSSNSPWSVGIVSSTRSPHRLSGTWAFSGRGAALRLFIHGHAHHIPPALPRRSRAADRRTWQAARVTATSRYVEGIFLHTGITVFDTIAVTQLAAAADVGGVQAAVVSRPAGWRW